MLLEKRSALPIEESTDEEEGQEGEEKEKKEKEKKTEEKRKDEISSKDEGKMRDRTETAETESSHPPASNIETTDENASVKEVKEKKGNVDKDKWG